MRHQWGRYGLDHDGHCTRAVYGPSRVVLVLRGSCTLKERAQRAYAVFYHCLCYVDLMASDWVFFGLW